MRRKWCRSRGLAETIGGVSIPGLEVDNTSNDATIAKKETTYSPNFFLPKKGSKARYQFGTAASRHVRERPHPVSYPSDRKG